MEVQRISSTPYESVDGRIIDRAGFPFTQHYSDSVPFVVGESGDDGGTVDPPLSRLSTRHGRSFELGNDESQPYVLFADKHGNPYTATSLKGCSSTKFDIVSSATAPSGYIPYGLQEDDALVRIVAASNYLREQGVGTEWIVGAYRPEMLIDPRTHERITQQDYKVRMTLKAMKDISDPEDAQKAAEAIMSMNFVVTERAMDVNHRITDFFCDSDESEFYARLEKILHAYNIAYARDTSVDQLDIDSAEGVRLYFTKIFPSLCAKNLAKMHDLGMWHGFSVLGNMTALGSVIDLDSVKGEPLGFGDGDITIERQMNDLQQYTRDGGYLDILYRYLSYMEVQDDTEADLHMLYAASVANFRDAYCSERGFTEDSDEYALTTFILYAACEQYCHKREVVDLDIHTGDMLGEVLYGVEGSGSELSRDLIRLYMHYDRYEAGCVVDMMCNMSDSFGKKEKKTEVEDEIFRIREELISRTSISVHDTMQDHAPDELERIMAAIDVHGEMPQKILGDMILGYEGSDHKKANIQREGKITRAMHDFLVNIKPSKYIPLSESSRGIGERSRSVYMSSRGVIEAAQQIAQRYKISAIHEFDFWNGNVDDEYGGGYLCAIPLGAEEVVYDGTEQFRTVEFSGVGVGRTSCLVANEEISVLSIVPLYSECGAQVESCALVVTSTDKEVVREMERLCL